MPRWRDSFSIRLRDVVLRHYLVPYSPFGLDTGLVPHLERDHPVTLVDIGANRGDFAASVEAHCGVRSAVMVEPQPELAAGLRRRFVGPQWQVFTVGVSDTAGTLPFSILGADSCSSLLTVKPDQGFRGREIDVSVKQQIEIEVVTLDELLDRTTMGGPIDLMKIDTQGTELPVLRGARRTLRRVRLLWIEVSFRSLYEGDALFPEIHQFLSAEGFRFYSLHEVFRSADREMLQGDALFLGPPR